MPRGTPMPYEWAASDADQRSEEFRIVSVDSCGNKSDDQVVVPHKTIHLRGYIDKCEGFARVSWNNYQGFGKSGVSAYQLMAQTHHRGHYQRLEHLYVGSPSDTAYTQYNLKNNTEYCYRVQADRYPRARAVPPPMSFVAWRRCPIKSRILYLAQVTNDYDRGSLALEFWWMARPMYRVFP
ncbi:MAG: hypothetical protein U5L96_04790 [Owenweeksia sp.]|nr:hypothetical protein [Owenweeksia sp.]